MGNKYFNWLITIRKKDFSKIINFLLTIKKDFQKIVIVEVKDSIRVSIKLKKELSFEDISKLVKIMCHKEPISFKFEKIIYFDSSSDLSI